MVSKSKRVIGGITVEFNELSVADVRNWLKQNAESANPDLVDCLLFDDFSLADVPMFCDLSREAIEAMTPSDLRKVVDTIKEVNPHFFGLRGRLVTLGKEFQAHLRNV